MRPSNSPSAIEERRAFLASIRSDLATAELSALTLLENDAAGASAQLLLGRLAVIRAEIDLLEHLTVPAGPPRSFKRPVAGRPRPRSQP